MSAVAAILLGDAEKVLRREADRLRGGSALDRLLAAWLLPDLNGREASNIAQAAVAQWRETQDGGAPRSYQAVAALALATTLSNADSERITAFKEGLDWALGTATEVDGTAVGLAADPPAVLAVVSALVRTGDTGRQATMRSWLAAVLDKFDRRLGLWERAQLHVGAQLLGGQHLLPPELSEAGCVTRVAVAPVTEVVAPSDGRAIMAAVLEHHAQIDAIGAAFLLASLSRAKANVVRSIRTDVMAVGDVLRQPGPRSSARPDPGGRPMSQPTSIRPHDRVTPLASKLRLRASMRASCARRTCPDCQRGNALCRYSRMDDRWMRCRYCGVVVDGEAVRHE